ncbi:rhamnogalacturonate lyase [Rhizoctonia solani AG-3 Rhs1AP]|uniref:rhamnogalacturonan endolyase n=1 Tax=Rhizoctonia solani AG-3 Rhs1AP TaxID=1086054 RepID=X8JKE1_9AGAM|nr:rhamnogalacturonate lyase [Rhizoctonia solani AG-3 Rhs1AP]
MLWFLSASVALYSLPKGAGALSIKETSTAFELSNGRLSASMAKSSGVITTMSLDGQDLLGTGRGLYLDCSCTPAGFYTPGTSNPIVKTLNGTDSTGTAWGGFVLQDTYPATGQLFQQYWFLRDGESGLHSFSRAAYYNETTPFLRDFAEFRTLFRPTSKLWTHISTNRQHWAPLPSAEATANQVVVQDATWYLGNTPNDSYVQQEADYFTKYTFADTWRDHKAHGLYADGSTTNGTTYGAWLVMNTRDTYFGGPIHSDLTVDGIAYNYVCIGNGFDRTFGPFFYYFNSGKNASLDTLRDDAERYANPEWNAAFYDSIASSVPNYVTTSHRGAFSLHIDIPAGAKRAIAILSENGLDPQDNAHNTSAYQYWGDVSDDGNLSIPRVKEGTYRLTVYADGIFGQYVQDNITVKAGVVNPVINVTWKEESTGKELWRLGTPDKTAGEYRHGFAPDPKKPLHPEEYRIYWGYHDFPTDFPNGVNYTVGKSDVSKDWNYVHWSVFGPSYTRTAAVSANMNNWTINFEHASQIEADSSGTLTIQLAAAKSSRGYHRSFHDYDPLLVPSGSLSNFTLQAYINDQGPLNFDVLWYQSSNCAVRSGISCYNIAKKLAFPGSWLKGGWNKVVLSLPFNKNAVYVQYDALRMELN